MLVLNTYIFRNIYILKVATNGKIHKKFSSSHDTLLCTYANHSSSVKKETSTKLKDWDNTNYAQQP